MFRAIPRHAIGAAAAWLLFCAEGVLAYLALLAYAFLACLDPGGPLAGILFVLLAGTAGGVVTALVVFPSVLVAQAASRLRWLAALAMATALLGLAAAGWSAATDTTVRAAAYGWLIAVAATTLPLVAWSAIAALARARAGNHGPTADA
ncbi:hypothetical protein AB0M36_02285 [Actinoplanes sp. NPDC051346]|uniref:hypothetical protein n=1 Tax=Actinoplanes sp. NPDC051346 TaxID=3155048 RepID=UPI0034387A11